MGDFLCSCLAMLEQLKWLIFSIFQASTKKEINEEEWKKNKFLELKIHIHHLLGSLMNQHRKSDKLFKKI